jgi:hypothetical protein
MAEIASGTTVKIQFYLKQKTAAGSTSFALNVIGVKGTSSTAVVSQTILGPAISGTAATILQPVYQFDQYYYYSTTTSYNKIIGDFKISTSTSAAQQITLTGTLAAGAIGIWQYRVNSTNTMLV